VVVPPNQPAPDQQHHPRPLGSQAALPRWPSRPPGSARLEKETCRLVPRPIRPSLSRPLAT